MLALFQLASQRHEEITKEAIAPLAAAAGRYGMGMLRTVGGAVMKRPGLAAGAAFTGMDLASGAAAGARSARRLPPMPAAVHNVGVGTV